MGTVYLAHDEGIDRHVAVKVLRTDDEQMRRRFRSEARSVGRLKHPNIVTVYDYSDFEGSPCIVMEFVEGETLAALIKRNDPISDARKVELIEQVCTGLAYAHRAGIVHRDIKPSNLMLDHDGAIKIVDFGIARTNEPGLTMTGKLVGTLAYMAPEQVRGESVDRRCDIFSVGVVLYEFLTGKGAFPGDSDYSIVNRIVTGAPEPFRHPDAVLAELIVPVIDTALAKDPNKRYQDANHFATALAAVRARLETRAAATTAKATTVISSSELRSPLQVQEPVETIHQVRAFTPVPEAAADTNAPTVRHSSAHDDAPVRPAAVAATLRPEPRAIAEEKPAAPARLVANASATSPSSPSRRWNWWIAGPALAAAAVIGLAIAYTPLGGALEPGQLSEPGPAPIRPVEAEAAPSKDVPAPVTSAPTSTLPTPVAPSPPPSRVVADQPDAARPAPVKIDKPAVEMASPFKARLAEAARLFEDGDYAAAVSTYEGIIREDPRNTVAATGLGIVRRAQQAEQKILRDASGTAPLTAEQNRQLSRLLQEGQRRQEDGEYNEAIAAYEAVLKVDPKNARATTGLADTRKAQAVEAAVLGTRRKKPGA